MKAYKKLLPKYWLGTRMPNSLGYQPNLGIGGVLYSSLQGEILEPEIKAAQANIIPGALNRTQQSAAQIGNMWQHVGPTASSLAITNNAKQIGSALMSSTNASEQAAGWGLKTAAEKGAFTKTGLTSAGKALGVLGTVYGIGLGVSDWIHEGDHRSSSDMANTLTTNTYTSDRGNSYKELAGFNRDAELAYERANRTSKNVGNIVNGIGTGAALGSVIGNLPGAIIGGAGGLLYGLGSMLFGFGDNEEEVRQNAINTENYMAMFNRQLKSASDSADVRDAFYSRDKAGTGHAAEGKMPVFGREGKLNAWVSNGEKIGNLEEGWEVTVPGKPNKKDNVPARLREDDYVLSKEFSLLVDAGMDRVTALMMQDMKNKNKKGFNEAPKYNIGKTGEYLFTATPHLSALFNNWQEYNRIKNSDRTAPREDILDYGANEAAARTYADQLDGRELFNQNNRTWRLAAWNAQRTPGLGLGGRATMLDSLYRGKLASDADIRMKLAESNRGQRNVAREMMYKNALNMLGLAHDSFWKQFAARQQINAAYENWLAQNAKNNYTIGSGLASDILGISKANKAYDIQNRMIGLYDRQADLDEQRWRNEALARNLGRNPAADAMALLYKIYGGV